MNIQLKLPQGYLDEEVRCGYTVTHEMKKVWAVLLDLWMQIDRICKKYGIPYYGVGGTALGAVRHQGIIPWDDDIDLGMMRSDYERFCEVAKGELSYPYFLQTEYTDKGSLRGHAIVKNSSTTGAMYTEIGFCKFNMGIGVDIFPFDNVTDDKALFQKQQKEAVRLKKKINWRVSLTDRYDPQHGNVLKRSVKKLLHIVYTKICPALGEYDKLYQRYEQVCRRYNDRKTKKMSFLSFDFPDRIQDRFCEDYEGTVYLPFEFLEMPVPAKYDHALKERFGDYMKFVVGTSSHSRMLFDTERPYTEYMGKGESNGTV